MTADPGGTAMAAGPPAETGLWGHYAGAVSRFVAYVVDLGVITGVFMLTLAAASYAASLISGHTISWSRDDLWWAIAYGCWWFLYFAYSWAANGKTFGMALLGIRVVSSEGDAAGPARAIVRTVCLPLSFVLFGLGFLGILVGRQRRALHDVLADTTVVYTWHARAARLRYLARDEVIPGVLTPKPGPARSVPAQAGPPAHETAVKEAQRLPGGDAAQ